MSRRKRIPYDPPNKRKRRRRDPMAGRGEQGFLTRRMFVAKAGVIAVFSTLAVKLGIMQLEEGEEFKAKAKDNVLFQEQLLAPRGLILDRKGRSLAENRRAWEVRVIPADLPDKGTAERQRVLDTLATALQLEDVLVINPNAVPENSTDLVYSRVARMMYPEEERADKVEVWKTQSGTNDLVKVANLSIDDAARFRSALAELPGVQVMNEVEYLVTNIWAAKRPVSIKRDVPREVALRLEANLMYLPGVVLDGNALVRDYKGGEVMSHVVGYVQTIDRVSLDDPLNLDDNGQKIYDPNDFIGREGLEAALEPLLRGKKGSQIVEKDVAGVQVRVLREGTSPPEPGTNVRLTIDLELQNAVGKVLKKQIDAAAKAKAEANAKRQEKKQKLWEIPQSGAVVAFDPRNGEVLAMVSYPHYDNQLLASGISARKWKEYIDPDKGNAFLNRCTNELYPPGSTFKIFLAASALNRQSLTIDQTYTCEGAIKVINTWSQTEGQNYACWVAWQNNDPHGEINVYDAIEQSCDVFFYNTAVEHVQPEGAFEPLYYRDWNLNADKFVNDLKHPFNGLGIKSISDDMHNKFWFGSRTGIEIFDVPGLFPDEPWKIKQLGESWTAGDSINVSIGQGDFTATVLQLAMNTASIATGKIQKPHLVHQKLSQEGKVEEVKGEVQRELHIALEHLDVVREGMRRVVNERSGTAHHSRDKDGQEITKWPLTNPPDQPEADKIVIAGKTGTSEFGEEDDIGAKDTHAWFTCYAPFDDPEIAVSVVIEKGGEGSTFAVPVADEVLRAYFELTGKRPRGKVLDKNPLPAPGDPPREETPESPGTPAATPGTPAA
jgi:penicillin-binding protein 2